MVEQGKGESTGLIPGSEEMATDPGHGFATTIHFMEGSASNYYAHLLCVLPKLQKPINFVDFRKLASVFI